MAKTTKKPHWLFRWFDSEDSERDVKLLAFLLVVVSSIYWLSRELWKYQMTDTWVDAFYGLCALVGLGGSAWALVDRLKGRKNEQAQQGAENPEEPKEGEQ